jgi:hypothetical protein
LYSRDGCRENKPKTNTMENQGTQTATYTNKALNETYTINGVRGTEQAWDLAAFVCRRNNWSLSMFCNDVTIKIN